MSAAAIISSFIESAPPGELAEVVADIKNLDPSKSNTVNAQADAFRKYNEEQFITVTVPGRGRNAVISKYNSLAGGRYYDADGGASFRFDHVTSKASDVQDYSSSTTHTSLLRDISETFSRHANEHYSEPSVGVFPTSSDAEIAIVLVANKYSPNNFWNGRWRSSYTFSPSSKSLKGTIKVDVHYYEDGNVRLQTEKTVTANISSSDAAGVVREIANAEKAYHESLNRAFVTLSEGAFKGLRRQLPVTRQKVEWEKIGGYRIGQDIGGGRSR